MENNTVTLSLGRYDELKECEVLNERLILSFAILLDKARLNWNGNGLAFDDYDDINDLIKAYDMEKYLRTIEMLKKKKEKGEKTDE